MGANNRSNTEAELRLIAYAGNRLALHERKDKEVGTYILAAAFLIGSLSMLAASYQPVRIYSVVIMPRQDFQKRQFRQDVFRTVNLLDENARISAIKSSNITTRIGTAASRMKTTMPASQIEQTHQVFLVDKNYFLAAAALALIGLLFMLRTYADVFRIVRTQSLFEKELNNITQE